MPKEIVHVPGISDGLLKAKVPISAAVKANGFVFVSGQPPMDPATGKIEIADIGTQTRLVLENVKRCLEAAGSSLDKVVKVNIFITNAAYFAAVNEIMGERFSEPYPARAAVGVRELPRAVLLDGEVESGLAQAQFGRRRARRVDDRRQSVGELTHERSEHERHTGAAGVRVGCCSGPDGAEHPAVTGGVRLDARCQRAGLADHGSREAPAGHRCEQRDRSDLRAHDTVLSISTRSSAGMRPSTVISFQPAIAMTTPIDTTIHPPVVR